MHMKNRTMLALLFAAWSAQPFAAAAQQPPFDLNDPAQIAAGQQIFNTNCAGYCHGKDGMVGRGPSLRGRTDLGAEQIRSTILNGRRDTGKIMPAWKGQLDDKKVWQLTAFILSLRTAQ
jgi:mono/diheme cytochrome c family protein